MNSPEYPKVPLGNYIGIVLLAMFVYFLTYRWEKKNQEKMFFEQRYYPRF
jgi:preprotein translocase subunit YajC